MPFNCEGSDFMDKYHKHKVTGDLRIMKNNKLGSYSPKVLENNNILWKGANVRIMEGINDCIETCNRHDTDKYMLKEWKVKIKARLMIQ